MNQKTTNVIRERIILAIIVYVLTILWVAGQAPHNPETMLQYHTIYIYGDRAPADDYRAMVFFNRNMRYTLSDESSILSDGNANHTNALSMIVKTTCAEYLKGEPVVAVIILRNQDKKPNVIVVDHPPERNYDFFIKFGTNDYESKPVMPKTPKSTGHLDFNACEMQPNTQIVALIDISRLFSFADSGEYALQARLHGSQIKGGSMTNLQSNWHKFAIVDRLSELVTSDRNTRKTNSMILEQQAHKRIMSGTNL